MVIIAMPPIDPEVQYTSITAFSTQLALRPDAERVRALLAAAFVEHVHDLWPAGEPAATPEWISTSVDEILATLERLYQHALCVPPARQFLDRMCWLPPLLHRLDQPVPLDG
jgi:hypothetical protein